MRHERVHHPNRRAPCAIRRAHRLHDVLEHRGGAEHPAGAASRPGQIGVLRRSDIERRQILIEPQDVRRALENGGERPSDRVAGRARRRAREVSEPGSRARACSPSDTRTRRGRPPGTRTVKRERSLLLVQDGGREPGETMGDQCSPQIDRFAAGSAQLQRERRRPPSSGSSSGSSSGRLPFAERPHLGSVPARSHRAPLAALILRPVEEHRGASRVVADPEPFPTPVELGEERRSQDPADRTADTGGVDMDRAVLAAAEQTRRPICSPARLRNSIAAGSVGWPMFSRTLEVRASRTRSAHARS